MDFGHFVIVVYGFLVVPSRILAGFVVRVQVRNLIPPTNMTKLSTRGSSASRGTDMLKTIAEVKIIIDNPITIFPGIFPIPDCERILTYALIINNFFGGERCAIFATIFIRT